MPARRRTMPSQQSGSSGTAFEQALRGAGIETVDDITALNEQRRAQRAEQRARSAAPPSATPKPAAPPRPPTVRERMRDEGIIPVDELLSMKDGLLAEVAAEGARFQAEAAEAATKFDELCRITAQLGAALQAAGGRRGSVTDRLREQFDRRCEELARIVREDTSYIEVAARIGAMADVGEHFGHLGRTLFSAAQAGICELVDDHRYHLEVAAGRGHLVLSGRAKERYLPRGYQESLLVQLVTDKLRRLQAKAIETADRERAAQLAILNSGQFPKPLELIELLDPGKPIEGERTFGCLLVQFSGPEGRCNGFVEIRIATHPETGTKCIAVERVVGGAQRMLQPVAALLTPEGLQEAPAVGALVQHLRNVAIQALMSDDKAAEVNGKLRELGQTSHLIPEKEDERWFRFKELRGDAWRARNKRWIGRNVKRRTSGAAQQVLAAAAEAAGGAPAAVAPAPTGGKPKGKGSGKGRGKGKGDNGVPEGAAAAPTPTDDTPTS